MRRLWPSVLMSSVWFFSMIVAAGAADRTVPSSDFPQAYPVVQLLRALETDNAQALEGLFCERVQKEITAQYDWPQVLSIYKGVFGEVTHGPVVAADFSFTYQELKEDFGLLAFYYKGEALTDARMRVTKEEGAWKLAEK